MGFEEFRIDRLAAAEAVLDFMPEPDRFLAQHPAQIHFTATVESGEVDQAETQVFDEAPVLLNGLHGLLETARERVTPEAVADSLRVA